MKPFVVSLRRTQAHASGLTCCSFVACPQRPEPREVPAWLQARYRAPEFRKVTDWRATRLMRVAPSPSAGEGETGVEIYAGVCRIEEAGARPDAGLRHRPIRRSDGVCGPQG